MLTGLVNSFDSLFIWFSSVLKQNFADYCDLETAQDEISLVTKDGSLVSLIKIEGYKNIISGQTFYDNIVHPLNVALQPYLEKRGHMVQFWFMLDPEKSADEITRTLEPAYQTAKRLNLDVGGMLDERVKNLSSWISVEENYLVLWTRPTILTKNEQEEEKKTKLEERKNLDTPPISTHLNVSDPLRAVSLIRDRHNAFVSTMSQELDKFGLATKVLNVIDCVRMIKKSINPQSVSGPIPAPKVSDAYKDLWTPFLPGDPINPSIRKVYAKAEEWDIVWPKLSWQICDKDATVVDGSFVKIGSKLYAPLYIDLMPKEVRTFGDLFGKLISKHDMPWRISYMLEGDGVSSVSTKALFASILGFAGSDNKLIARSVDQLKARQFNGETIIKIRISLCTWANADKKEELTRKLSDLASSVESWGSCLVSEVTGDPIAGIMSSALGATTHNIGTVSAAPLEDAIVMLPLTRPCSPWPTGAITFRSPDGKIMPYQPGSNLQTTWISLIFAKPGSGKSVLMNMSNLALCLSPGITNLPRIGIVDIGPSSSGLISLLKEALPLDKKHLVEYYRLRMTEEFCVNPFDTQLGCRFPTAEEKAFLANFLTLLATDPNDNSPDKGMIGLVNAVIDAMYLHYSDKGQAKTYDSGLNIKVDEALSATKMNVDSKTTWWEVVDWLFLHDKKHEASLAQRFAVPILSDAPASAQDEKIRKQYMNVIVSTGENLVDSFNRLVSDALGMYKILTRPTVFDIGESRVVALDLDEVAKSGGVMADRQTAVMYMLARYILGKDFKLQAESVNEMPYPVHVDCPATVPVAAYRDHHRVKIEGCRDDLKRLCFDEFHRTSKAQMVREQIIVDMREGRKWGIDVTLASQSLDDFDKTMQDFATSIFIMDGGNAQVIEDIAKVFGMQDIAEKEALLKRVHGPKAGGATFLAKFSTKQGWFTQLLTSTLGPVELWAFSTTVEDVSIRTRLYKAVGPSKARKILALAYPNGSAKEEIEYRKEQMKSAGVGVNEEAEKNIYDTFTQELIKKFGYIQ